jgi:hypothetical protein
LFRILTAFWPGLSITATKLETIYVEAMAALERYFGKPKDQTNENAQTEVVEAITIEGTPCVITRQVCACYHGGFKYKVATRDSKSEQVLARNCASRDLAVRLATISLT